MSKRVSTVDWSDLSNIIDRIAVAADLPTVSWGSLTTVTGDHSVDERRLKQKIKKMTDAQLRLTAWARDTENLSDSDRVVGRSIWISYQRTIEKLNELLINSQTAASLLQEEKTKP